MNKVGLFFIGITIIIALGLWALFKAPAPAPQTSQTDQNQDQQDLGIQITTPTQSSTVASPLSVVGLARGSWFFEAQFPVELRDANNTVVATGVAKAGSDWMTTNYVPFSTTLTWTSAPSTATGYLHFVADNPSGNPNPPMLDWPISF